MNAAEQLNPIIHTTTRLAIMSVLAATREAEFATVRELSQISDSALSKQAVALKSVGYLQIRKGHVGRRPRTWLALTEAGRVALRTHIAALRQLVDLAADGPAAP